MPRFSKRIVRSTIGLAIFGFSFVRAGIDFTPTVNEYVPEGGKLQQLAFQHNKMRIENEPPRTWIVDGGATALHLKPPQKTFAESIVAAEPVHRAQQLVE